MSDVEPHDAYVVALIELYRGLERKGPGDERLSLEILDALPPLPPTPRIVDLGCGSGAGTLLLARRFQSLVSAVDFSSLFLAELEDRARERGIDHLVHAVHADMGRLDWPLASIDLLWSEGAAYILGFEEALRRWRPLLADGGIAVISEMTWFTDEPPAALRSFWQAAYPMMSNEAENALRAERAGYEVLFTRRLPPEAWWTNFYSPLRRRMQQIDPSTVNQNVLRETEDEIDLYERFSEFYGYTFYALRVRH